MTSRTSEECIKQVSLDAIDHFVSKAIGSKQWLRYNVCSSGLRIKKRVFNNIIIAPLEEHETHDQDVVMAKGIMRAVGIHFTSEMVDEAGPKQLNRHTLVE